MRKIKMISVLMLAVLLIGVLTLGVSAEQYPDYLVSVTDKDNLLSTEDERRINEALLAATEAAGIPVCAYVFASDVGYYGRVEYFGDDFLSEPPNNASTAATTSV
ncbi:MAG: hypothetical protein IIU63_04580 [Clostridia bacterium]|nr:hypothetical protein [Clostridia bacterium]